jgi:hypothetical protein
MNDHEEARMMMNILWNLRSNFWALALLPTLLTSNNLLAQTESKPHPAVSTDQDGRFAAPRFHDYSRLVYGGQTNLYSRTRMPGL